MSTHAQGKREQISQRSLRGIIRKPSGMNAKREAQAPMFSIVTLADTAQLFASISQDSSLSPRACLAEPQGVASRPEPSAAADQRRATTLASAPGQWVQPRWARTPQLRCSIARSSPPPARNRAGSGSPAGTPRWADRPRPAPLRPQSPT